MGGGLKSHLRSESRERRNELAWDFIDFIPYGFEENQCPVTPAHCEKKDRVNVQAAPPNVSLIS